MAVQLLLDRARNVPLGNLVFSEAEVEVRKLFGIYLGSTGGKPCYGMLGHPAFRAMIYYCRVYPEFAGILPMWSVERESMWTQPGTLFYDSGLKPFDRRPDAAKMMRSFPIGLDESSQ